MSKTTMSFRITQENADWLRTNVNDMSATVNRLVDKLREGAEQSERLEKHIREQRALKNMCV